MTKPAPECSARYYIHQAHSLPMPTGGMFYCAGNTVVEMPSFSWLHGSIEGLRICAICDVPFSGGLRTATYCGPCRSDIMNGRIRDPEADTGTSEPPDSSAA